MGKRNRNPTEAIRIWASKFLDDFCASGDDAYAFEQHLSNSERSIIHQMCKQMGIQSKSSGSGKQRRLSLFKGKGGISKSDKPKRYETRSTKRDGKGEKEGDAKGKKKSSQAKLKCVSFPLEAKAVLWELFNRYPPSESDTTETSLGIYTGHFGNQGKWRDDFFRKPQFNKEDMLKKVASLSSRLAKNKGFREIFKARTKLPIASFRDAITSAVESNQVVLIAGETGCGKTTQVPQYLLDHMWYSKRETCKIICTQPRRISAISVSERIAWERGETIGNNIGYKVRLQSEGGRQSSVVFCTNGILLRVLVGKGVGSCVPDITHIIVDEIHERDCYSDFMLAIIRDLLPSNPHLRLILMSATLDAERFSGYFGGCPVVRVPGFTYPVRTFYLEDAVSVLKSDKSNHIISADSNIPDGKHDLKDEDKAALDEAIDLAWTNDEFDTLLDLVSSEGSREIYNYRQSSTWLTPLMVFAGKGRVSNVFKLLSLGADCKLKSKEGLTALELAQKENQFEAAQIIREHEDKFQSNSQQVQDLLDKYIATVNPEEVDVGLIVQLMKKICSDSQVGAVLVFLPGWEEISKTKDKLLASSYFADSAKFNIICLHSRVPADEQKKVFNRPPRGCRKIVLATNIAESAVTIDDVVYVIDSGRMKEKSYDPYNDVSTLQSSWVSKANAKQREGRAGRCQPGICYHLYSKLRAACLPEYRVPEVRRMPVDELCLQVKMLDPGCSVYDFLQKLMDPPVAQSIANALTILKDVGALTSQEELTELGQKFGQLPVHPRISKMLYFAIIMNCLDPALILACAADTKDPFIMPLSPSERKDAVAAKRELASLYGDHSDQLATVAAFQCWKNAKKNDQAKEFCSQYFVSPNAMRMLNNMRDKLHGELKRHGLIPSNDSNCSLNAHDPGILRAVLAVGLYPMVGRMCPPSKNKVRSVVETVTGAKVRVLSLSNIFNMSSSKYDDTLIVFDEITRGDWGMHIRSCTVLPPIPLLLFSREIAVAPTDSCDADKSDDEEDHEVENVGDVIRASENVGDDGVMDIDKAGGRPGEKIMCARENFVKVVVDRWLPFEINAFEVAQIYILRQRLMASILFKVKYPQEKLPPHLGASMYAIACILSEDGLTQPSSQTVAVEPVASVVDATSLRDEIPSADPNGSQEYDPSTTPMGSKLESANNSGLADMEESLPSYATSMEDNIPSANPNESHEHGPNTTLMGSKLESAYNSGLANMEESLPSNTTPMEDDTPSANPNWSQEHDQSTTPMGSKLESVNNLGLANMEESLPANLGTGNEQPDPNTTPLEDDMPSANPNGSREQDPNTTPMGPKLESANNLGLANMEESLPSNLGYANEQPDANTAPTEAASAVKEQKKKQKPRRRKSANNFDLGNMEENMPSGLDNGNQQTELKSANKSDLGKMEESLLSNPTNVNEQPDPNTAPMEAVSAVTEQKKKRKPKRRKSANNLDLGNMEEDSPSDLANGNHQTELKSANKMDLGQVEESLPPNLANGNEQLDPNTAPTKAASAVNEQKKKRKPKRRKLANNLDLGIMEENKPSGLANGNEQTDPKSVSKLDSGKEKESMPPNGNEKPDPNAAQVEAVSAAKQPKKKRKPKRSKLANNMDSGNNMKESMPSTNGNEQPNQNSDLTEAASMAKQQNDEVQTEPKLGNNSDLIEEKESMPSDHVKSDEQPDPNTAPMEAVSAAKQPKRRSRRRKSANNLDLGNHMEENTPSTNGNEQPNLNSDLPEAASMAKQQNDKVQTEPKLGNDSDSGNHMEENTPSTNGNEQPNLNSDMAEAASMAMQQNNEVQTEPMSDKKPDLIKEKESMPFDHVKSNEQPDPMEAVSAAKQPKRRFRRRKSANNLDSGNHMEENRPSTNGNEQPNLNSDLAEAESMAMQQNTEQPDPNTAPAAKQPKRKSKKRKSANNLDSGNNTEENMPSAANGNEQPKLYTDLTEAASMAKQQKNEVQTEPMLGNKSDLVEKKESEQPDPNTAPTEAASMENNSDLQGQSRRESEMPISL